LGFSVIFGRRFSSFTGVWGRRVFGGGFLMVTCDENGVNCGGLRVVFEWEKMPPIVDLFWGIPVLGLGWRVGCYTSA
jgi:hypothetical protein